MPPVDDRRPRWPATRTVNLQGRGRGPGRELRARRDDSRRGWRGVRSSVRASGVSYVSARPELPRCRSGTRHKTQEEIYILDQRRARGAKVGDEIVELDAVRRGCASHRTRIRGFEAGPEGARADRGRRAEHGPGRRPTIGPGLVERTDGRRLLDSSRTAPTVDGGELALGGVRASELADEHGTPLVVYCEETLRARGARVPRGGAGRARPLQRQGVPQRRAAAALREEGLGADVSTLGELASRCAPGIAGERIVVHGNNKSRRGARGGRRGAARSSSSTRPTRSSARPPRASSACSCA